MNFEFTFEDQQALLVDLQYGSDLRTPRMVVVGDLDAGTADQLQKAVIDVLRRLRPSRIDLDFRGVTLLGAAGVAALVECQADARQVECRIALVDVPPAVHQVLRITGLLAHFGVSSPAPRRPIVAAPEDDGGTTQELPSAWPAVSGLIRGDPRYRAYQHS
jgi:anti-anti-sigma factor